jgi:septal ring factor EnvC (AmiA/AmiB activator)
MIFNAIRRGSLLTFGVWAGLLATEGAFANDVRDLEAIEQQLGNSAARQAEIGQDIASIEAEAEAISRKLIAAAQSIQAREAQILAIEQRIEALSAEELRIKIELAAKQDVLSELLAGLQRLEQNPPPALVVEPGDILGALRGAMMFGSVVPELRGEAENLAQKLARLENIRAKARAEQENLRETVAKLTTSQDELAELQSRKKELLAATSSRLVEEQERARELAAKATQLKQLVEQLAIEQQRREAEAEKKRQEGDAAEKLRQAALLKPRHAFADLKGHLDYPAQGQLLQAFGDDDGFGSKVKGLYVATRAGAQVIAPADGHVEFAGPFRSYGHLMIINAGNGYLVLLAGMGEMTAETGQFLRAGEPVGTMGDNPAPGTLTADRLQDSRPVLYIEYRKNGETIDSSPWWIGGAREARG